MQKAKLRTKLFFGKKKDNTCFTTSARYEILSRLKKCMLLLSLVPTRPFYANCYTIKKQKQSFFL